ncbi:MAG: hypothetical protein HYV37_01985 [Candidatus Levyibacteriota bacterium]|nr:MAG: hypothetical protein HYV37_01985 [Candidatus Levybacteria bacterium]
MRIFNFQFSIFNFLAICYTTVILSLFFFSFTQVDLGLTLSQWSVWQEFQKFFQTIGYFQRPFSTVWYTFLLIFLFGFYFAFLYLAQKKLLTEKQITILILLTSAILFFSYNAFSYDLFNYIFDVKIVTFYHQNPYTHRALDYMGNPMLGFMHWTQRTYPYGPFWLLVTIPFGLLDGFRLLLPTMMLFKGLAFISYLGTVLFLKKILDKVSPKDALFGIVFFAFNPLVLIESLVSAHNDIFMMFLSVWAFKLLLDKKYFRSFLLLVLSIGVKFATVFLIPVFLLIGFLLFKQKKINWNLIFLIITLFMIFPVVVASVRTNFQPWYLLYILPFVSFLAKKYFILIPSVVISLFALFEYAPFLYTGNWNSPIPVLLETIRFVGIGISAFLVVIWFIRNRFLVRHNVLQ